MMFIKIIEGVIQQDNVWQVLPVAVMWCIWKGRNIKNFKGINFIVGSIILKAVYYLGMAGDDERKCADEKGLLHYPAAAQLGRDCDRGLQLAREFWASVFV
ncbi:hypothetical protein FRX31_004358 [Thalictrum thalictroides]|uniref:Uncharacterized protein n=1 Tax=Thalictrum thalictroides TaxID=46969 RepID=A0A7J6XB42_THATH|nr:hypothetical protein FRX31_004358 [Thalictrum thalictroides]